MTSNNIYVDLIASTAIPNKYTKWYIQLIERAQNRATSRKSAKEILSYVEGHHVLPKCLCLLEEQKKDIFNIAFLTPREHFVAHWLLTKMFKDSQIKARLQKAMSRFCQSTQHQNRTLTSVEFEALRRSASNAAKVLGSNRKGYSHSTETRKNISNAVIGKRSGSKHFNFGNHLTEETKLKISETLMETNESFSQVCSICFCKITKGSTTCLKHSSQIFPRLGQGGSKNPNAKNIKIFDSEGNLKFECVGNFIKTCQDNGLPLDHLRKSYATNLPVGSDLTLIRDYIKPFLGWFAIKT